MVSSNLVRVAVCGALVLGIAATASAAVAQTLAELAKKPLAECQTVEYQLAVARAGRAAGAAGPVAEAVETAKLLPVTAGGPSTAETAELADDRTWLEARGGDLYTKALEAQAAGDLKTAVKSYLLAVKCNQAVLGRDDHGLREIALGALRKMADKHPEKPVLRFQLGFYSYLFGDLTGAGAAFAAHDAAQTDPYLKWRGGLWIKAVEQDTALMAKAAATPLRTGGAVGASEPEAQSDASHKEAVTKASVDAELKRQELDAQIAEVDQQITEMQKYTHGGVVMVNGQQMIRTYNQHEVKRRLEDLEARKAQLIAQR